NRDGAHDDGHGQSRSDLEGVVRDGEGQPQQPSWRLALGGWLGVVLVRRGESHEDDVDQLQTELSRLSHSRPVNGLGLCVRVSTTQVGNGRELVTGHGRLPSQVRKVARGRWMVGGFFTSWRARRLAPPPKAGRQISPVLKGVSWHTRGRRTRRPCRNRV